MDGGFRCVYWAADLGELERVGVVVLDVYILLLVDDGRD